MGHWQRYPASDAALSRATNDRVSCRVQTLIETRHQLVVYTSVCHGNTRKIAEALAETIGAAAVDASTLTAEDVAGASLIGFGSGIFFGKHHQALLSSAAMCRNNNGTKSFLFSTAGFSYQLLRFAGIDFHKELRRLLTDNGYDVVGEFSCLGYDTYGPFRMLGGISKGRPNTTDIERAKTFALRLMDQS